MEQGDKQDKNWSGKLGSVSHSVWHRLSQIVFGVAIFVVILNSISEPRTGAYLEQRSVTPSSAVPGAVTNHEFKFDLVGIPFIGSMAYEYCANSPLVQVACIAPTGLDTSQATLTNQSGGVLDFVIHPDTGLSTNRIIVTRTPSAVTPGPAGYRFSNITNPDGSSPTIYVRVAFYSSTDGTGVIGDSGSVSFSIQNPLTISLYVPPYLALCSGVTVAVDCATTNGSTVDLGELSQTNATTGTTQFAVATNSSNGYAASIQGSTMTAGNRVIAAMPVQTSSQTGTSQFGINLRANTNPSVGQNVAGVGTGVIAPQYNSPNQYRFVDGDILATSSLPTEWNRYTISFVVNVGSSQPAGRYATTMTVIATTTF